MDLMLSLNVLSIEKHLILVSRERSSILCNYVWSCSVSGTSPLELTLLPGVHRVRVRPTVCGREYRAWNKKLTIP